MCTVSDRLILCSCPTKNVEELEHYWVLQRPTGDNEIIYGQAIWPANIGAEADKLNSNILAAMLNKGNCFDIALQHQENDILELHFSIDTEPEGEWSFPPFGNFLAYCFLFKNNQWEETDYDPFEQNLSTIQQGKIKNPF